MLQVLRHAHAQVRVRCVQIFAKKGNADEASPFVDSNRFRLARARFEDQPAKTQAAGFGFELAKNGSANAFTRADGETYIRLISPTPGSKQRTAPQPTGSSPT